MASNSTVMGCFELGVDIKRGAGTGTTSVVFSDVVVNRNEKAGDRAGAPAKGLLVGLTGFFPTGVKCDAVCPPCPPSGGGGGPVKCETICFGSPLFFRNSFSRGTLPDGLILIPGANFNNLVSVGANDDAIDLILRGGSAFGGTGSMSFSRGSRFSIHRSSRRSDGGARWPRPPCWRRVSPEPPGEWRNPPR